MLNDEQLLAGIPDFLSVECMLKATPAQEGQERFVYIEASNEGRDQQNEIVLAKALEDSIDHFIKFGAIDIDHKSMPAIASMYGIANPQEWEIGVPVEARVGGKSTFVKAQLYSGDTPLAAKANEVWDAMTKLRPAKRFYASVGGKPLAKSVRLDPESGDKVGVVSALRWTNLALTAQPVNQHVSGVSTQPFGMLAKSWCDGFVFSKALEASYATDASAKTGGAALGMQSLDGAAPHSYYDFRERMAAALKSGKVAKQTFDGLMAFSAKQFNLSADEAAEWVDRFLSDLKSSLTNRSKK